VGNVRQFLAQCFVLPTIFCWFQNKAVPLQAMNTVFMRALAGFLLLITFLTISSCDPYQKLLKSSDYKMKYEKVKEFYNEGQYEKALPLFEELMGIYKGTKDAEKLYYYYAFCHFGTEDYLSASHYFKTFLTAYPRSIYAEEAQFMIGYSYYKMSPQTTLEQANTQKAIDALQMFINAYPNSSRIAQSNNLIDELRQKLETKALSAADLYYKLKSYKAAATSYRNILLEFPDTKQKEEIMFKVLKAYYLLAINSIETKKRERFLLAVDAFDEFAEQFPASKYYREAEKIYSTCTDNLSKSNENVQ